MTMYNPPHPGEALRLDVLPALGISLDALAAHLGYSARRLHQVINCHAPIRAELAHRLELAGLGTARQYLAEQQLFLSQHQDDIDLESGLNGLSKTYGFKPGQYNSSAFETTLRTWLG